MGRLVFCDLTLFRPISSSARSLQEMFFVAEGLAEVFLDLSKPALATVGKGKFFGEGALLEREPRNAYIRAKTQM